MKTDTLLTLKQVCDRLRISRTTAIRYLYNGWLPGAVRLPGGRWRIPTSAVDWLMRREPR